MFNIGEYRKRPDRLADYLPWAALIAPGVVLNKDGSYQKSIKFRGPDLDSSTKAELRNTAAKLNNALRRLGTNWCIQAEAARRHSMEYPESDWPDGLSVLIDKERRVIFEGQGRHFESEYYLTFTYLPPDEKERRAEKFLVENAPNADGINYEDYLEYFQNQVSGIVNILQGFMPVAEELDDEETLTYLHSCISTRRHRVSVPENPMYIDSLLTDTPFSGGLAPKLGPRHLKTVSIRGYISRTFPGLLDSLNQLPIEYRWTVRYLPLDKQDALKELRTLRRHWFAKRKGVMALLREAILREETALEDTEALGKAADANDAIEEVGNDVVCFGYITASITVWDESLSAAQEKVRMVQQITDSLGFVTQAEDVNAVDAWLGSLPGHAYADVRRPMVSSLNLCHLLPMSAIWAGPERNEHLNGPPLMVTRTRGSTPFRLSNHVGDVAHMFISGPTGSGKSFLLNTVSQQFLRYPGAQVYIFDKGASSRCMTLGVGGEFYDLAAEDAETPLSFQPLAEIDRESERTWALEWLVGLLEGEKLTVTPEIKTELWSALSNLASDVAVGRTITNLAGHVQDMTVREALQAFQAGGPHGHLLDADHDGLAYARWQTFEMEELMEQRGALAPVLTYLFHRLERRFTGAPTMLVLDEAWLFLTDTQFAAKIKEWLKVLRKKNVSVVFTTQSLADVMDSEITGALIESCPTRIFLPNERANEPATEKLYRDFGLNDRQIEILATATAKREYYFQSRRGNRLFELSPGEIAMAFAGSSTPEHQQQIRALHAEHGTKGFASAWLRHLGLIEAAAALDCGKNEMRGQSSTSALQSQAAE